MSKVIVIDDVKSYCKNVCDRLQEMGIEAISCNDAKRAKWLIERAGKNDVILADLMLKEEDGTNGTDILRWMRETGHHQMFFLMTSFGSMENSIETLELGAKSYIPKEQMNDKFYAKIVDIMQEQNLRDKRDERLIYRRRSQQFLSLYENMKSYVGTDIRLVLVGESGTGRGHLVEDLLAMEGLHSGDYAHVPCKSLEKMEHVEEYFFGHHKGSFPSAVKSTDGILEMADNSYLFLENVDEMPLSVQKMLAGVLTTGEYMRIGNNKIRTISFRVISTSAVELEVLVRQGRMTQEFLDLICEDMIHVPPLRETAMDIVPMANFFIESLDKNRKLSKEAGRLLEMYTWPGNVRELVRVITAAIKKYDADVILPEHLSISVDETEDLSKSLKLHGEEEEKNRIVKALESHGYNREKAADALGISRRNLFKQIKHLGIEVPERGKRHL
ncbi:MAG: sigma-54-dependent Fis family transcriptional regulator [Prevotella sp.]|nr:sigma-54-dependent Fis family transcriptional regulator [Prevotella sp.]